MQTGRPVRGSCRVWARGDGGSEQSRNGLGVRCRGCGYLGCILKAEVI